MFDLGKKITAEEVKTIIAESNRRSIARRNRTSIPVAVRTGKDGVYAVEIIDVKHNSRSENPTD